MGLGLPQSGGDFNRTPIIKYDARAGRIFRMDRSQDASGSWQTNQVEVTQGFQAIFDLENIETGWLNFPAGGAPDIRTVKIGNPLPERPSQAHRTGFRVHMKLGKSSGGDLREMAANAQVSIAGMDALYDAYLAGVQDNPGKLPIVTLDSTTAITKTGKDASGRPQTSTNYQPVWKITGWAPRPEELPVEGQAAPNQATQAAPAQQQAAPAQATQQQAELAPAGSEEF